MTIGPLHVTVRVDTAALDARIAEMRALVDTLEAADAARHPPTRALLLAAAATAATSTTRVTRRALVTLGLKR